MFKNLRIEVPSSQMGLLLPLPTCGSLFGRLFGDTRVIAGDRLGGSLLDGVFLELVLDHAHIKAHQSIDLSVEVDLDIMLASGLDSGGA